MFKLLKYEFRKTAFPKLVMLALTVLAEAAFLYGYFANKEDAMGTAVLFLVLLTLVGIALMGIMSLVNLHRDMNTKQGYMLFMTPNSCYKILGAKVLECGLSLMLAGAFFFALAVLDMDLVLRRDGVERIWDVFNQMLQTLNTRLEINVPNVLAVICYIVTSWLCTVTTAFLADVISSALLNGKKGNLFITFLLFLALSYLIGKIVSLVPATGTIQAQFLYQSLISLGFAGLMYFVTAWIMEKYLSV